MAQHVETGAGLDGSRHGPGIERITNSQRRLQIPMGYAALGSFRYEVKNGGARGLTSSSRGRRDCNKRTEWLVNGASLANRCVNKVQQVSFGIIQVEVHELGRVHDRTAANSKECIWLVGAYPADGLIDSRQSSQ